MMMKSPVQQLLLLFLVGIFLFSGSPGAIAQYDEGITDNPPVILQPADDDVVRCLFNMVWTASPFFSYYQVIIYPMRDGMSPAQAVRVEHPAFEQQVSGNTALLQEDVSLPDGEYVMIVAVPEFGLYSEPVAFTYCCGNFAEGPCAGEWEEEEEAEVDTETIESGPGPRNDVVYDWEDDVEELVDYYSQLDLLTMEDDCEDISRKLQELIDLIFDLNLEYVETEADIDDMLSDIADAHDAIDRAEEDKADAEAAKDELEEKCERIERQQNDIFDLIMDACGGTPGLQTETGVDCPPDFQAGNSSYAAVGPTPGLPLGAGNVACLPGHRVDDFLDAVDTWRDNLEALEERATDCRKEVQEEQDKIDAAEDIIEDSQDLIDDLEAAIADAEDRLEEIDAELDALQAAIEELFALEDICPVIIAQLKEEYAEASAQFWHLVQLLSEVNNQDTTMTTGNDPYAQDLFDQAEELLEQVDSMLATGHAGETDSLLHVIDSLINQGYQINNVKDCMTQIKMYLDLLGYALVNAKNNFPNSSFSNAVDALNRWRDRWEEAKEACDAGDISKAKALCNEVRPSEKSEDSYYPVMLHPIYEMITGVVCNEGDTRIGPPFSETRQLGSIIIPHAHSIDEYYSGNLQDFLENWSKEMELLDYLDVPADYTQSVLDYTKAATHFNEAKRAVDIYLVSLVINCKTSQVCVNGRWVTSSYVECQFRVTQELISELHFMGDDRPILELMNMSLSSIMSRFVELKNEYDPPVEEE